MYETSPEFRPLVLIEPLSGRFETEKLEIGSPPVAQLRRSFVAIACGTDWERLEHTGGEPGPIRMSTVCSEPISSVPNDPVPVDTPR